MATQNLSWYSMIKLADIFKEKKETFPTQSVVAFSQTPNILKRFEIDKSHASSYVFSSVQFTRRIFSLFMHQK